jgi:ABC-type Fe3+ transport system substrate-binding protein
MRPSRTVEAVLLLLPLLALPAALAGLSREDEPAGAAPSARGATGELVVTSPQWEGIKQEFERGFRAWLAARGEPDVRLTWLDHGGGTQTLRWIEEQFRARPAGIGVDLLFGGGTDPFEALKAAGLLERHAPDPAILAGVARDIGGFPVHDPDGYWFGTCLTGFGVMSNRAVFAEVPALRGLAVRTWEDLADPRLFGWVGSADPRSSSSYHTTYEIVLQSWGFERGMALLRVISGNCSAFSRFSSEIPKLCTLGQFACAPAIDQYAQAQIDAVGPVIEFTLPQGRTLVNPDAAAILRGAPNLAAARRFVDFLLSEEAGRLWMLHAGEPGGPRDQPLSRASVRPALYAECAGRTSVAQDPFALRFDLEYDYDRASRRWNVLNDWLGATLIDVHEELRAAVAVLHGLRGPARERAEALLARSPASEAELLELAARGGDAALREERRVAWTAFSRATYREVTALVAPAAGGAR